MKSGRITMIADLHNNRRVLENELYKRDIKSYGITDFEGVCNMRPLLQCANLKRMYEKVKSPKSIIVCLFPYFNFIPKKQNLSLYAALRDYHSVITPVLSEICEAMSQKTGCSFMAFTDNSPIPEVTVAVRAGLGVRGDNGLLISEKYGSFVFIGEIVTDMPFEYTISEQKECCHCGECKRACPTKRLSGEGECLSHITQKKGELTENEKELIKNSGIVWGCDICQLVCPMNKDKAAEPYKAFVATEEDFYITKDQVPQRIQNSAFSFRGDKPILRNLDIVKSDYSK